MDRPALEALLRQHRLMVEDVPVGRGVVAMKVLTVLGTRPEIIRLSLIIGKLDAFATTNSCIRARTSTPT